MLTRSSTLCLLRPLRLREDGFEEACKPGRVEGDEDGDGCGLGLGVGVIASDANHLLPGHGQELLTVGMERACSLEIGEGVGREPGAAHHVRERWQGRGIHASWKPGSSGTRGDGRRG